MMLSSGLVTGSLRKNLQPPFHVSGLWGCSPVKETPGGQTSREHAERGVSTWYCADGKCTGRSRDSRIPNTSLWRAESSPGFSMLWVCLWASVGRPASEMLAHAMDRPRLYPVRGQVTWPIIRIVICRDPLRVDLFGFHQEFSSSLGLCKSLIEPQRQRTRSLIQPQCSSQASSGPISEPGSQAEASGPNV